MKSVVACLIVGAFLFVGCSSGNSPVAPANDVPANTTTDQSTEGIESLQSKQTAEQALNCPAPLAGRSWCLDYPYQGFKHRYEKMNLNWDCTFSYSTITKSAADLVNYQAEGTWQYLEGHLFFRGSNINGKFATKVAEDSQSYSFQSPQGLVEFNHCGDL
ncbi:MAG: hypothetical protein EOP06_05375 [Proteobacteria bacterium]|nr:MAG: hypothetical protein EOP06_05375 [Pseudomonadota bacterium]